MGIFAARFLWTGFYFVVCALVGVVGYMVLEGWGLHDALYMTAITLTAVGYQEVAPLSAAGRNFTMVLLGLGVTGLGLWFALLTSFVVEFDLTNVFRTRRVMKQVAKLRNHVVVCGAGRAGRQVAHELRASGVPFVVIEKDEARIARFLRHDPEAIALVGDATTDSWLEAAGIHEARGLVTCLGGDTDNLFVCLSARSLSPDLTIVARAQEEETTSKLYKAGATHVVSPVVIGGIRMASALLRPAVVSFLDVANRSLDLTLRLEQAPIREGSSLVGKTLAEARIPDETGLIVIALKPSGAGEHDFIFNPRADTPLAGGDQIIVLGTNDQVQRLLTYAGG